MRRILTVISACLLFAQTLNAQTTLGPGDIAFASMNTDGATDEFAFVVLKDMVAGTTITFTDYQWLTTGGFDPASSGGACASETTMIWTAGSDLTVGTIVYVYNPGGASGFASEATASNGTIVPTPSNCPDFSFPPSGECIYAYQGTRPTSNSATNFLAAINMDGAWLTTNTPTTSGGAAPPLASDQMIVVTPEVDNATLKCSVLPLTGTASEIRSIVNNLSNWDVSDATAYTLPRPECASPPTITATGTLSAFTTCIGTASTAQSFTVSGVDLTANLTVTAPTGFEVSTSSGSGYAGSLNLSPSSGTVSTTTIYVRITAAASGSPSGNVACTSTGATTKNVAASGTVNTIPATPTITPGGPTTFCTGGSVNLSSSSVSGNQWRLDGNPIGGATNQSYSASAAGTYTVVVTISGCVSPASLGTSVTVNSIPSTPTVTPGGATTFCSGGSVNLTSSSASGNQWRLDGNPIGGATDQSYSATATGSYTVVVTASGCSSSPSSGTGVTVNTTPSTPSITPAGPTSFCSGGSVILISSAGSGNQWYLGGNPIGGATNQFYTASAAGDYTVISTVSGCASSASSAVTVSVSNISTASGSQINVSCFGGADGSATVSPSGGIGGYTYSWAPSGGTGATASGLSEGMYTVTVTDGINCTANRDYTITEPAGPVWVGGTSTDWNDASNWCGGVPASGADVTIEAGAGNYPQLELDATVGDLTVAVGAEFFILPSQSLTIQGDLENNGLFTVMADNTGIGSLITEGSISGSGTYQMQQYLTGTGDATPNGVFYYVGSPVVGATAATYDLASGNKLWSANELTQDYDLITNDATPLIAGQGYAVRLGSDDLLTMSGTSFNTGVVNITGLTRTGIDIINPYRGYNLVSNPYPSSVNWSTADKTNLEPTIWYRTHNGSTMLYDTYNLEGSGLGTNNNGGGEVSGLIPPTQAFWVRVAADGQTGSISFDNNDRSHGSWSSMYKQEAEEGTVRIKLGNGTISDEAIIHFNTEAMDARDAYDSEKMWADGIPQLYTTTGADSLVINGLYSIETNPIVDLGIKAPTTGNYTITTSSITLNEEVWLEDRALSTFQHLNINPVYAFVSNSGNIGDRFALHFGMMAVGIGRDAINGVSTTHVFAADGMVNVSVGEDAGTGTITILDMAGRTVQTAAINGSRTVVATDLTTGIYLVRVETAQGAETHRIMLR